MDITLDDVRQLVFDLWIAQREANRLQAENAALRQQLGQQQEPAEAETGGSR